MAQAKQWNSKPHVSTDVLRAVFCDGLHSKITLFQFAIRHGVSFASQKSAEAVFNLDKLNFTVCDGTKFFSYLLFCHSGVLPALLY